MPDKIRRLTLDAKTWKLERARELARILGIEVDPASIVESDGRIQIAAAGDETRGAPVDLGEGVVAEVGPELRELVGFVRREAGDSSPKVGGWASFLSKDRHRELVLPASMQSWLKTFMTHPVMLLGHNSRADQEMPIGSFREVKIRDLGVEVEGELLEEHPKHKLIMAALSKGLLMWSIGFIPVKGRRPTADELKAHGDDLEFVWEEIELIEISLVTIGSNRQAIAALREMQSRYVRTELVDADYEEVLAKMVEVNDKLNSRLRSVRPLTRKSFDEHREKIMKVCSDFVVALDGALKALGDEVGGGEPEGDKPEGDKPAEGGNGNGGTPPPPPPPKKDTTAEALLNDATAQVKALFAGDGANPPEEV